MNLPATPHDPAARRGVIESIRQGRDRLGDRVHAAADGQALASGWTVTETTGWLGLGGRTYRDPRFGVRAAAASPGRSA